MMSLRTPHRAVPWVERGGVGVRMVGSGRSRSWWPSALANFGPGRVRLPQRRRLQIHHPEDAGQRPQGTPRQLAAQPLAPIGPVEEEVGAVTRTAADASSDGAPDTHSDGDLARGPGPSALPGAGRWRAAEGRHGWHTHRRLRKWRGPRPSPSRQMNGSKLNYKMKKFRVMVRQEKTIILTKNNHKELKKYA